MDNNTPNTIAVIILSLAVIAISLSYGRFIINLHERVEYLEYKVTKYERDYFGSP